MARVSGRVSLSSRDRTWRNRSGRRSRPSAVPRLEFRITHMLMKPGRQALAIVVNYVIGQSADWPVHAGSLTDQAPVELGITAID